jgi:hypothetical protein
MLCPNCNGSSNGFGGVARCACLGPIPLGEPCVNCGQPLEWDPVASVSHVRRATNCDDPRPPTPDATDSEEGSDRLYRQAEGNRFGPGRPVY